MAFDATPGSTIPQETIDLAKDGIVDTISKYVDIKKAGKDYAGLCPFHSERTPSFTVSEAKGIYQCFGCGAHGDAIDFVMEHEGVPFHEAVQSIVGSLPASGASPQKRQSAKTEAVEEWKPITPVPASAGTPMDTFSRRKGDSWEKLKASRHWAYRDAAGQLIGYIHRFELPGGGKDLIPQSFCVNSETGEMRWKWLSFAKPRPIYGLDKLAKHPNAQVVIVEGEKACDKAQERYEAAGISRDKLIVVAWPGGGKAVKHVDWSPLVGRNVGLWPDADQKPYVDTHPKAGELMPFIEQPGTVCMVEIAGRLEGVANAVKFIMPPKGVDDGWDLADELPDGFNLLAHTKAAALLVADFLEQQKPAEPATEPAVDLPWEGPSTFEKIAEEMAPEAPTQPTSNDDDEPEHLIKNKYFTILGYDHDEYHFFVHSKQQVLSRSASQFSDISLLGLANDINWWEMNFPKGGKEKGIDIKSAFSWVQAVATSRGVYDPTRIRGRGAWVDDGRMVFHHGAYLTVDGVKMHIPDIKSAYVYPMGKSFVEPSNVSMTVEEGRWLLRVAEMIRWRSAGSAALMAGWTMLAPICGALKWRPHIWITGAAGSGKSTVQRDFCVALLNGVGEYYLGDSSEPGIRQDLKSDAIPVLIDEIESNNETDRRRVEGIIGMVRKSSSETQAKTAKGTATGDGMSFMVRSMFCLSSINVNLPGKADIDRLTKLVIRPPAIDGEAHWAKLADELYKITSDATISRRLLARALSMMPIIQANILVFTKAAAAKFGTQRHGDQYGTLLAGCWCLTNDTVATPAEAEETIGRYDWNEHTEDHDEDDATDALKAVMNAKIRMPGNVGELTVFELVQEATSEHRVGKVEMTDADATLRRHGIRVEMSGWILFGTSVTNLKTMLRDSSCSTDIRGQLLRLKGATRWNDKAVKFNGINSKCVAVPIGLIFDDEAKPPAPSASAPATVSDDFPI